MTPRYATLAIGARFLGAFMLSVALGNTVVAGTITHDTKLGFEEEALPKGWRVFGGAGYAFSRDTAARRTGKASGRVSMKSGLEQYGFPGPTYQISGLDIPEGEAHRWEFSFYCKTRMAAWGKKGTGRLYPAVEYLDADGKRLRVEQSISVTGTTGWHRVTLKATADHNCKGLNVRVISYGPGEAWVDDIRFVLEAPGELHLAGVFSDSAVLQRDAPMPVWGWARPGAQVTVEFAGQKRTGKADTTGKWRVTLDAMPASAEPRTLVATSSEPRDQTQAPDLLVGDVWLCSGQSNMGFTMAACARTHPPLQRRMEKANNLLLRLGSVPVTWPAKPLRDIACTWRAAAPDSARVFSAIGYLFGERVQREIGVPVGIINGSRGGTWIENWLPQEHVETLPSCELYMKQYRKALADYPEAKSRHEKRLVENKKRVQRGEKPLAAPRQPRGPDSYNGPGRLFNGMIAPLVPYPLKGVLWYQGEGNVWEFSVYDQKMVGLINSWRGLWKQPDLPFFMTELAPFNPHSPEPQDSARCRFGVTLAKAAETAGNAWTITITDGGEQNDIHPRYKEIPAERFAAMTLAKVYGKEGVCHGPLLKSWKAEAGKAILTFAAAGDGLQARTVTLDGHNLPADKLVGFELAGKDRRFFRATARTKGSDTAVVSCPNVPRPVAVRYAWANFPLCNLYNKKGFAAYPFRTDDWPWPTPK
jgi:sialate O-acetylesterase